MKHDIPVAELGAQGELMAHAVDACVHCGFCLPACPTYQVLGDEMDSPRGRIFLMKEVLEGGLPLADAAPHLDRCLGCQGCVSACPTGVPYGELLSAFRGWSEPRRERGPLERAKRYVILNALPRPGVFRAAARLGRLAKPLAPALPAALRAPLDLLPQNVPPAARLSRVTPALGKRRARVALLAGCAQQVIAPNFGAATLRVLARNGVEVVIPPDQGCCGAAAMHTGARAQALAFARANLAAFPSDVDAIITNAAGCGAGLKEYPALLAGERGEEAARRFAPLVRDVSVFLMELGLEPPPPLAGPLTVAYHDACHLAHAQGVRAEPRALLRSIPGLEVLEVPEGDLCCGSAGTYNLEQPQLAAILGERKARHILQTGARAVVSGNVGCHTQIVGHLRRLGSDLPAYHTVELLDLAYRGEP